MPRVAALLAAGGGSRFEGPQHKLLAMLQGRPVWEWALQHVTDAGFDHVVVVSGAAAVEWPAGIIVRHNPGWSQGQASSLRLAVEAAGDLGADAVTVGLADQPFVTAEAWRAVAGAPVEWPIVIAEYDGVRGPNPDWSQGQAGSLRLAVEAAGELGANAVTVGLADQPFVTAEAWRAVAGAPVEWPIVIAEYDGVRGPNPVRLGRSVWSLLPADGDAGARGLIREHPEWVCSVACVGSGADIDTLEDLARWNRC